MQLILFLSEIPVPFGPKHLIGTGTVLLVVTITLILTLKVFKNTNKMTVLRITTLLLLLMEVFKQTLALRDAGWNHYPLWALPLQLCSVSIYLMPLVAFGNAKVSQFFRPGCFTIGLFASLAMLCYPSTVLGGTYLWSPLFPDNEYPLISFTYHAAMLFFSLFLLFGKVYVPNYKDFPRAYLTMASLAVLAIIANFIYDTDMMFLNTAYGFPLAFFLSYGRLAHWAFMAILSFSVLSIPFWPSLLARISQGKKAADAEA